MRRRCYGRSGEVEEQRLGAPANDIAGAVENLLDHYEIRGGRAMRSSNLDVDGPLADLGRRAREFLSRLLGEDP